MKSKKISLIIFFFFYSVEYSDSQDTVFVYDVTNQSLTYQLLPAYNVNAVSDSTNAFFGINGNTGMPSTVAINTYPGTQISLIQNAADYYSTFNYPFTAVTLIRYGYNVTASLIGRRTLLVFKYDIYNPGAGFRNLWDNNPFYENGAIQSGFSKLTPVKYYYMNSNFSNPSWGYQFAVVEVAENIGDDAGYFGIAFDTTANAYDSLLLNNISYPAEGYPTFYASPVNGDTLSMKYGYIGMNNALTFGAYYGGNGEYTSPYFDTDFRIHGIRWSSQQNHKIGRKPFYFLKYVTESLATSINIIKEKDVIKMYPNPAFNILNINFSQPIKTESILTIKNVLGQIVITQILYQGEIKTEADIKTLRSGIYFAVVQGSQSKIVGKFIKQ